LLVAAVVWLVLLGGLAAAYHFGVRPYLSRRSEVRRLTGEYATLVQEARKRNIAAAPLPDSSDPAVLAPAVEDLKLRLTGASGLPAPTAWKASLSLDSFSGYAIFRSEAFKKHLASGGGQVELVDDGADYTRRLRSIATGQTPMAVFTVDALIKTCADTGAAPATIVLVIDESVGADAMVGYSKVFPNLDALNRPDTRIVAVRSSPSETLARVVMGSFDLRKLPKEPFAEAKSAQDVLQRVTRAKADDPTVYVLWEPYVSKALQAPGTHVLIDSSKFRGYIVDVLVAQREYLLEHEDHVRAVVEAYLRAAHDLAARPGGMADAVRADAAAQGEPITADQATRLAKGIWWKNTTDNYADLGVAARAGEQPGLVRSISNITQVLMTTGAIQREPLDGDVAKLFYPQVARSLQEAGFHPGLGAGKDATLPAPELVALTPEQWDTLVPVGTLQVERIVFARGTGELTEQGRHALGRLAETLRSFPNYYVLVRGQSRADGDADANRQLAERRAAGAAEFLMKSGIAQARIRTTSAAPAGSGGESQSVTFVLGQLPY
jgi:outer membrane protein OmpA-like peptidoglycan-associated protein